MAFRDNVDALPAATGERLELLAFRNRAVRAPSRDLTLVNAPGKTASYRIFHAEAAANHGLIDAQAVERMLETYAEIVQEARSAPNSHPTVDFLLDLSDAEEEYRFVCKVDGAYF